MFMGTWALIRPIRNIFSPVSGWNALSYKYLHLHNSSSVIFNSARLSPFLNNIIQFDNHIRHKPIIIQWTNRVNYLYLVTTSRAYSSCFPVTNKFKGFVTARKWSALPLYVLWSQYGLSMSILFDILPTPPAPPATRSFSYRLLSHTCSVCFLCYTATHPHHAALPRFLPPTSARSVRSILRREDDFIRPDPRERTLTRLRHIVGDWIEPLHNAISPHRQLARPFDPDTSLSLFSSASHPFEIIIDNARTPARPPPTTDRQLTFSAKRWWHFYRWSVWRIFFFFFGTSWNFILVVSVGKVVKDFFNYGN